MNSDNPTGPYQQLKDLLNQSNRILVAGGNKPDLDSVAAVLGLSGALKGLGKAVNVVYPPELPSEAKSLLGWEEINVELTKNFVITLTSAVGNVEKVSYYTEGDDLNLVVHPHAQAPPFSPDQVKYKEGGGDYDLIFTVGAKDLSDLGKVYTDEKDIFAKVDVVNLDKQPGNTRFGKLNMVYPKTSSLSEIITRLIENLELKIGQGTATNLLAGITWATEDFRSPGVSADTFEAAALCLRLGAQRLTTAVPAGKPPVEKREKKAPAVSPDIIPEPAEAKQTEAKPIGPKQDWLKPKIYQKGQLV